MTRLVNFRLEDEQIATLDEWAKSKGWTRSEAIRQWITRLQNTMRQEGK